MRFLLTITMLLFHQYLAAQTDGINRTMPTSENFVWAMSLENPTDEEVTEMVPLAENYFEVNYDSAFALGEHMMAIDVETTQLSETTVVRQLYMKALIFNKKQQNEQAKPLAENALERAEKLGDTRLIAETKSMLGRILADRQKIQVALQLFNEAADGFGMVKDSVNWVKNRIYAARVLGYIDSWEVALKIFEQLLPVAQRTQNTLLLSEVPYWMGVANGHFFLQYYNKIRNNDSEEERSHLDSIGLYYGRSSDYYEQSKSIAKKHNYRKFRAIALMEQIDNIIYYDNAIKGNTKNAVQLASYSNFLKELQPIVDGLNADEFKLLYFFSAGKVAVEQSDYATSIDYGEKMV
ncbi:MAG: tetratricopeptide repeat protein [Bacteroidota bacterium]